MQEGITTGTGKSRSTYPLVRRTILSPEGQTEGNPPISFRDATNASSGFTFQLISEIKRWYGPSQLMV